MIAATATERARQITSHSSPDSLPCVHSGRATRLTAGQCASSTVFASHQAANNCAVGSSPGRSMVQSATKPAKHPLGLVPSFELTEV